MARDRARPNIPGSSRFNSIAPVKRAASSAPHADVADHSFMVAFCCEGMCICANAGKLVPYILVSVPKSSKVCSSSCPKIRSGISIIRTVETSVFSPERSGKVAAVAIVYMVCRTGPWQEVPLTWRQRYCGCLTRRSDRKLVGYWIANVDKKARETTVRSGKGWHLGRRRTMVTTGSRSLPLPRVGAAPRTREAGGLLQRWSADPGVSSLPILDHGLK